jgi:chaperonin GroES
MFMDITKVKPTLDRLLIEITEPEEQSLGGIYLPRILENPKDEGIVVAIGPGGDYDGVVVPLSVSVGQKVKFPKNIGTNFKWNDKEYKLCREIGLLGIIE